MWVLGRGCFFWEGGFKEGGVVDESRVEHERWMQEEMDWDVSGWNGRSAMVIFLGQTQYRWT